jgi:curved DNA-binding protein CbpA
MIDYYKVLGIAKNATESEVKSAFRKLALKFHPDRHATSSQVNQDAANKRFKEVAEAYEVLSDEKRRRIYNSGGRPGSHYGNTHQTYRRGGDAARGTYNQGAYYQGGFHPGRRKASPFSWNFSSLGFGRNDYIFHSLIITVAIIGFATAGSAVDSIWKRQNKGRSFEEAMEAVERRREQRTTENKESNPATPKDGQSAERT